MITYSSSQPEPSERNETIIAAFLGILFMIAAYCLCYPFIRLLIHDLFVDDGKIKINDNICITKGIVTTVERGWFYSGEGRYREKKNTGQVTINYNFIAQKLDGTKYFIKSNTYLQSDVGFDIPSPSSVIEIVYHKKLPELNHWRVYLEDISFCYLICNYIFAAICCYGIAVGLICFGVVVSVQTTTIVFAILLGFLYFVFFYPILFLIKRCNGGVRYNPNEVEITQFEKYQNMTTNTITRPQPQPQQIAPAAINQVNVPIQMVIVNNQLQPMQVRQQQVYAQPVQYQPYQ